MTAVLLWKEFREQRSAWLYLAFMGSFVMVVVAVLRSGGNSMAALRSAHVAEGMNIMAFALVMAQGVISGALLLAAEKDDGTAVFLDTLSGGRAPLWRRKLLAGLIFTLLQSLVMAVLAVTLGFTAWSTAVGMPLVALEALAWGMLGGALCRSVMAAVLTAISAMVCSWFLARFYGNFTQLVIVNCVSGVTAIVGSTLIYCARDRSRRVPSRRASAVKGSPAAWRVLIWLTVRQGRVVFAGGMVSAFLLGVALSKQPLVLWPLWPVGTMLMGIACGLAAFAPDNKEGRSFLGCQRFAPGTIWTAKTVVWVVRLIPMVVLAWVMATVPMLSVKDTLTQPPVDFPGNPDAWVAYWLGWPPWRGIPHTLLLLLIWPIYGFCFAQLCGQIANKPIVAAVLALWTSALLAALWLPSLLSGGVSAWQVLVLPVLALLTQVTELRLGSR